jgi:hypothetical protein
MSHFGGRVKRRKAAGIMIILGLLCWYSPGRTEVTLPESLAEIGDEAFAGCGAMNEVSVPESVTVIGEDAFNDCGEALLILTEAGSEAVNYARGHQVDYRAGTQYRALLIGQTYPDSVYVSSLVGPANDIEAMGARLPQIGWSVTTKSNLTRDAIRTAIGTVFGGATENDVSLLYYSGHGYADGSLVGTDGNGLSPESLRSALDNVPGRKVIVVDACYSGTLIEEDGEAGDEEQIPKAAASAGGTEEDESEAAEAFIESFQAAFRPRLRGAMNAGGYFVITAARANEQSSEEYFTANSSGRYMGVFTYYFCLGIGYNGASGQNTTLNADVNTDGAVSIQEAYAYAAVNATKRYSRQHAMVWPAGCKWFAPFRE